MAQNNSEALLLIRKGEDPGDPTESINLGYFSENLCWEDFDKIVEILIREGWGIVTSITLSRGNGRELKWVPATYKRLVMSSDGEWRDG